MDVTGGVLSCSDIGGHPCSSPGCLQLPWVYNWHLQAPTPQPSDPKKAD